MSSRRVSSWIFNISKYGAPQPSWATSSSVWPPAQLKKKKILIFKWNCLHFCLCLLFCHWVGPVWFIFLSPGIYFHEYVCNQYTPGLCLLPPKQSHLSQTLFIRLQPLNHLWHSAGRTRVCPWPSYIQESSMGDTVLQMWFIGARGEKPITFLCSLLMQLPLRLLDSWLCKKRDYHPGTVSFCSVMLLSVLTCT